MTIKIKQKSRFNNARVVRLLIGFSLLFTAIGGFVHTQASGYPDNSIESSSHHPLAIASTKPTNAGKETPVPTTLAPKETAIAKPAAQVTTSSATTNPVVTTLGALRDQKLYIDPTFAVAGRPAAIANQPSSVWLGGWSGDVQVAARAAVDKAISADSLTTLVAYNIPGRDCGSYSAGGVASSAAYKTWIRDLAAGIGNRKAIVILEPDALAGMDCLDSAGQAARLASLADAVDVLTSRTQSYVYIDAGHSAWQSATTMTNRLRQANVGKARGFSLNVSNFQTTSANTAYGNKIANALGKSYVIDTSRNGNGPNGEWCNPHGRALGERPTTAVGGSVDAYLWIKLPGESDGACNGGPAAGTWWPQYAAELVANAH